MLDQDTPFKPPHPTTNRSTTLPVILDCPLDAATQPITVGLPLPRAQFANTSGLLLTDEVGSAIPVQAEPLASWPDGSVRWLLLDFMAPPLLAGSHRWQVQSAL